NGVFRPNCPIVANDSMGYVPLPYLQAPKTAWLQSRTYTAMAGTPAAGFTGYEYRLSLTEAAGHAECLGGLVLNFGTVAKLPYLSGQIAEVFVITTGWLGPNGVETAQKSRDVVEVAFEKARCPGG